MRNPTIDIFRGICMLFVVIGHTSYIAPGLREFIYSFHMPAFFILSGYLFNQNKDELLNEAILAKFSRLVIPAWFMGLVCSIPFLLLLVFGKYNITLEIFFTKFYGTMTGDPRGNGNFMSTPIWFLFTLFTIEFIAIISRKICKDKMHLILLSIGILGIVISQYNPPITPFNLFVSLTSVFYFSIGLIVKRLGFKLKRDFLTQILFINLLFLMFYNLGSDMDLAQNQIGSGGSLFINILISLVGSYVVLMLSSNVINKYIARYLIWFGKNTMPVIGFDIYTNVLSTMIINVMGLKGDWVLILILRFILLSGIIILFSKQRNIQEILQGDLKFRIGI